MMSVATNLLKAKMANCTVWKSETARNVFTNPCQDSTKGDTRGGGKAEQTKNAFAVGAVVTSELIAEQRLTLTEDRNLHPKEEVLEVSRKKSKKHIKMCHWRPLKCCQTTETL